MVRLQEEVGGPGLAPKGRLPPKGPDPLRLPVDGLGAPQGVGKLPLQGLEEEGGELLRHGVKGHKPPLPEKGEEDAGEELGKRLRLQGVAQAVVLGPRPQEGAEALAVRGQGDPARGQRGEVQGEGLRHLVPEQVEVAHLLHVVVLGGHPEHPGRPRPVGEAEGGVGLVEGEGGPAEKPRLLPRDHPPHLEALQGPEDLLGGLKALQVGGEGLPQPGVARAAEAGLQGLLPLRQAQAADQTGGFHALKPKVPRRGGQGPWAPGPPPCGSPGPPTLSAPTPRGAW